MTTPDDSFFIHKLSPGRMHRLAMFGKVCYNLRMTRKDYILIASTIDGLIRSGTLDPATAIQVASRFSNQLRGTNPRFDCGRFYDAATKSLPAIEEKFADSCG